PLGGASLIGYLLIRPSPCPTHLKVAGDANRSFGVVFERRYFTPQKNLFTWRDPLSEVTLQIENCREQNRTIQLHFYRTIRNVGRYSQSFVITSILVAKLETSISPTNGLRGSVFHPDVLSMHDESVPH